MRVVSKITAKGQTTVPREVRAALASKPGDLIAWEIEPGGRVAVIDFRMDSPQGPPQNARIEPGRVTAEMKRAGYALAREHTFLPNQYFLVFQPAKS